MYDTSSTIPPVHLLSQQSNVRHFIHHPPPPVHLLSQQSNVRHLIHHPPCSSTIPIVKCTTPHPPSRLFICYLNSQMYDTSSTIPPVHLLSQQSNVRHFIHHPPCSSAIPIVNCTTPHPPYPPSSTIPIVKCTTLHPPPHCSATIPIVKCTTTHPPYPPSSTIPIVNVRHFIHHPPSSPISIVKCTRFDPPAHSSSTIPIVKCTTLHPPSPLFIYYPNSQMYDASSTMPPLNISKQSNVRHFIHHPPSSSTIPIVKCTTIRQPSLLFINYPNSQMYDTSSTIPPLHLLSQQSNVRHFIHNPPCSSTVSIVKCTTLHPPSSPVPSTIPIVKYTTLDPPSPLFIYYPNSQMYDTSSTIPSLHLLS